MTSTLPRATFVLFITLEHDDLGVGLSSREIRGPLTLSPELEAKMLALVTEVVTENTPDETQKEGGE